MTILDQRIAARDWNNVAKIMGCSVHAVQMKHDAVYAAANLKQDIPAGKPPISELDVIVARMKTLRLTQTGLAQSASTNRDFLRLILNGTTEITRSYYDRLMLAMDIVEEQKGKRAA